MRSAVALMLVALFACSDDGAAVPTEDRTRRSVVAARIVADDPAFPAASAKRPRFVPCQGLSGCARSSEDAGEFYPGLAIPPGADAQIDHTVEFALYLVAAVFERAELAGDTLHVAVRRRSDGFQMVKLDGREVLATKDVRVAFFEGSRLICSTGSSWEGCG